MPRESIQITGIHFEKIHNADGSDGLRVSIRTPDNAAPVVWEEAVLDLAPATQFIGAQALLRMKRKYQDKVTSERAVHITQDPA